ncbi:MAG: hypothetical protein ICV62_18570 [Cyanobacteria bacterium Co-bin13]|nr:hypothetical protein [Cyanobacteria bacterium Co-bin13]
MGGPATQALTANQELPRQTVRQNPVEQYPGPPFPRPPPPGLARESTPRPDHLIGVSAETYVVYGPVGQAAQYAVAQYPSVRN